MAPTRRQRRERGLAKRQEREAGWPDVSWNIGLTAEHQTIVGDRCRQRRGD